MLKFKVTKATCRLQGEDKVAQLHKSVAYFCSIGLYFLVNA